MAEWIEDGGGGVCYEVILKPFRCVYVEVCVCVCSQYPRDFVMLLYDDGATLYQQPRVRRLNSGEKKL